MKKSVKTFTDYSIRNLFHCILLISIMGIMLFPNTSHASQVVAEPEYIVDAADLLTSSEEEELISECKAFFEAYGAAPIILTHNDDTANGSIAYIEDYYDNHVYSLIEDATILLVDMANREITIESYGSCETYLHSKRTDIILDTIYDDLAGQKYYKAFETFLELSTKYIQDDSELNYDYEYVYDSKGVYTGANYDYYDYETDSFVSTSDEEKSIFTNPFFQIIVSFAIGGIAVACMASSSGGKVTTNSRTYLDHGNSKLVGKRDIYLRTSVTRIKKPTNNTSSGGGRSGGFSSGGFNSSGFRGGVSSRGHSHSTSSRRF